MIQTSTLSQRKAAQRKQASGARKLLHSDLGVKAAQALAIIGLDGLKPLPGNVISGFIPYLSEIDTRPLLTKLASEGSTTCVPVVLKNEKPLEFRCWQPGQPTVPGRWDIPVPPEQAEVVEPDVLLVPLLAYDRDGYRLGYGGGFYDRTLKKLRAMKPVVAVGVAYAGQVVDSVVRGRHDQPLDWILTEQGFMKPGTET
jgi:5-formyltetrahydrofolate cyclo-ligase